MKGLHLIEGRNTGFRKIINALKANGSPPPEFYTDEERLTFTVTLHIHPECAISGVDIGAESGVDNGAVESHGPDNGGFWHVL